MGLVYLEPILEKYKFKTTNVEVMDLNMVLEIYGFVDLIGLDTIIDAAIESPKQLNPNMGFSKLIKERRDTFHGEQEKFLMLCLLKISRLATRDPHTICI